MAQVETTPTASEKNTWFDALAGYALQGAEIYTRITEAKAAAKPNNTTVYRAEDATGAKATGTASTAAQTGKIPAWVLPVSIVGGGLLLVLAFLGLRRR